MSEIQRKYAVDDSEVLKDIEFSKPKAHEYTYYKVEPLKGSDIAVLRIKESEGKAAIDMKIRDKEGKWKKDESKIKNPAGMKNVLEWLGYEKTVTFHKTRQTFKNDFIRIDLDVIEELGTFIEVKFDESKEQEAVEFLNKLGIDVDRFDKRSILEIYLSR